MVRIVVGFETGGGFSMKLEQFTDVSQKLRISENFIDETKTPAPRVDHRPSLEH